MKLPEETDKEWQVRQPRELTGIITICYMRLSRAGQRFE